MFCPLPKGGCFSARMTDRPGCQQAVTNPKRRAEASSQLGMPADAQSKKKKIRMEEEERRLVRGISPAASAAAAAAAASVAQVADGGRTKPQAAASPAQQTLPQRRRVRTGGGEERERMERTCQRTREGGKKANGAPVRHQRGTLQAVRR